MFLGMEMEPAHIGIALRRCRASHPKSASAHVPFFVSCLLEVMDAELLNSPTSYEILPSLCRLRGCEQDIQEQGI